MQRLIVEAWQTSSLRKAQVRERIPSIAAGTLYRYLDGNANVYLRERTAEFLLDTLRNSPQGPKDHTP